MVANILLQSFLSWQITSYFTYLEQNYDHLFDLFFPFLHVKFVFLYFLYVV